MSYILTDEQVVSALRSVVEENPEKVYEAPINMRSSTDKNQCYYVHRAEDGTEECGCLVGTVLHRLGVSLADLAKAETLGATVALSRAGVVGVSYRVASLLAHAQRDQDQGRTWSEALKKAVTADAELHSTPLPGCGQELAAA
ncbi:hypothetical protein [Streptomyces sp. 4F14]|uniref:hypothetical protein n=1 Tax=Streptomyces sp. 4F14 TaxID=3394380 RepID=UPI003A8BC4F3